MSNASNYLENKLIDHVLRGQSFTPPATLYFGLCTGPPSDSSFGTEVAGGSYARVAVTASLANFAGTQGAGTTAASSGTGGLSSNNGLITFPTPSAAWGLVGYWIVADAPTGGNLLFSGALTAVKDVQVGDEVSYAAGAFQLMAA